ncbi:MAG: uracil-DNA glycosylase [Neisseriaceae bacterium]
MDNLKLSYLSQSLSKLNAKWQHIFISELQVELQQIDERLAKIVKENIVFPPQPKIFDAFLYTDFDDLSVVIIGQDPYHGEGQANGLAFSVNKDVKLPPSLRNIFVELKNEYGVDIKNFSGELLIKWARQGVLLLNSSLTVINGMPNSLANIGWHQCTDKIISYISKVKNNIVFLLWGAFAQQKISLIDTSKHLVLTSTHPSPFSVHKGFFGCNHFVLVNKYLKDHQKPEIDWLNH